MNAKFAHRYYADKGCRCKHIVAADLFRKNTIPARCISDEELQKRRREERERKQASEKRVWAKKRFEVQTLLGCADLQESSGPNSPNSLGICLYRYKHHRNKDDEYHVQWLDGTTTWEPAPHIPQNVVLEHFPDHADRLPQVTEANQDHSGYFGDRPGRWPSIKRKKARDADKTRRKRSKAQADSE